LQAWAQYKNTYGQPAVQPVGKPAGQPLSDPPKPQQIRGLQNEDTQNQPAGSLLKVLQERTKMKTLVTKWQFYHLGGFSNPKLSRRQVCGVWKHYIEGA
jgi:hypothetical protein